MVGERLISVFIGFGGTKAEGVAVELKKFLNGEDIIEPFLASPQSNSLPANTPNFSTMINQELKKCDIAVFVCHKNTPNSPPIKKEINFLYSKGKKNRIIPFAASDNCLPRRLRGKRWRPLHFPPEKAEESFPRLLNNIYRSYIELTLKPTGIVSENAPMVRQ